MITEPPQILFGIFNFALEEQSLHFQSLLIFSNYQCGYLRKKDSRNQCHFIYHQLAKEHYQLMEISNLVLIFEIID